jgi:hypothetical protein
MRLILNGMSLPIAQLGPDFLVLDAPVNHPPANASVSLKVDNAERHWDVRLPNGISPDCSRVAIALHQT